MCSSDLASVLLMAGLTAADRLESAGVIPVIYEANDRLGGRVWSVDGFADGLVAEAGGEMIDNQHKTMIAYANQLDLELEDYEKTPGDTGFDFFDGLADEADLVDEYCELASAMREDLKGVSAPHERHRRPRRRRVHPGPDRGLPLQIGRAHV